MSQRVVLNALALRPGGSGVQTYIRGLLSELPDAVSARLEAMVQADAVGELAPGVSPIIHDRADGLVRGLSGLRSPGPANLVHGLNVALPVAGKTPKVITVHDLAYFDVPWAFSRARAAAARLQVRASIRRADAIIAVSAFTAERVGRRFGRDAVVTPLAPGQLVPATADEVAEVRGHYGLPEQFVLHVGNVEPRKDVPTLAEGCRGAGVPLVLVGALGGRVATPQGASALGYVPQERLAALYGAATVVAYTSRYEGFGLPPLEAMACGAAVIASSIPALRETLSDAAEFVPVGDANAVAKLVKELSQDGDRRAALGAAARSHAAGFSWKATAAATAKVYASLGVGA